MDGSKSKSVWSMFTNGVKYVLNRAAEMFGLKRNSKYVKSYMHQANMRSGVYMAIVIVVLEIWMIIRQSIEVVKPKLDTGGGEFFQVFYSNTSNFWLMLFLGLSLFVYCLGSLSKKYTLRKMITEIVVAGLGLLLFAFLDYRTNLAAIINPTRVKNIVIASMLLSFYVGIFLFQVSVIIAAIYRYRGGKSEVIRSVIVITLFAFACLAFGMMVSYSDYFGYAKDPNTGGTLYQIVYDAEGHLAPMYR